MCEYALLLVEVGDVKEKGQAQGPMCRALTGNSEPLGALRRRACRSSFSVYERRHDDAISKQSTSCWPGDARMSAEADAGPCSCSGARSRVLRVRRSVQERIGSQTAVMGGGGVPCPAANGDSVGAGHQQPLLPSRRKPVSGISSSCAWRRSPPVGRSLIRRQASSTKAMKCRATASPASAGQSELHRLTRHEASPNVLI